MLFAHSSLYILYMIKTATQLTLSNIQCKELQQCGQPLQVQTYETQLVTSQHVISMLTRTVSQISSWCSCRTSTHLSLVFAGKGTDLPQTPDSKQHAAQCKAFPNRFYWSAYPS